MDDVEKKIMHTTSSTFTVHTSCASTRMVKKWSLHIVFEMCICFVSLKTKWNLYLFEECNANRRLEKKICCIERRKYNSICWGDLLWHLVRINTTKHIHGYLACSFRSRSTEYKGFLQYQRDRIPIFWWIIDFSAGKAI